MSLKAKIEAVIYASEEPVTLAQLTGLLGEEGQVELDTLAAQQQSLALEDESATDSDQQETVDDPDSLNAETINPIAVLEAESPAAETPDSETPDSETPAEETPDSETPDSEQPEPAAAAAADEKKLARDAAAEVKARERKLRDYFRSVLEELIADYANGDRGLEIREVAGGFRLGTKPEYHDAVRGFVKSLKPPLKLTLQALETLAVVAYKQPVTAPEVSEIRGVDSSGVLGSLLARKLVTTAGRKQVIGRPILYKTTKDFLLRFGLKDINELPSIAEFEKMAGELNDAVQEEIQMEAPEPHPNASLDDTSTPSDDATTPDDDGSPPLDELNAAPESTNLLHNTPEDLISDRSAELEGRNHEHADPTEVDPQASDSEVIPQADGSPTDETSGDSDA
jgi:segregation and condensation protein B